VLTFVIEPNIAAFESTTLRKSGTVIYSEDLNVFDDSNNNHTKYSIHNIKLIGKDLHFKSLNHTKLNLNRTLLLVTQNKVITLPASYCQLKFSRDKCNNYLYPYCIWVDQKCQSYDINFNYQISDYSLSSTTSFMSTLNVQNNTTIALNNKPNSTAQLYIIQNIESKNSTLILSAKTWPNSKWFNLSLNYGTIQFSMSSLIFTLSFSALLLISCTLGICMSALIRKNSCIRGIKLSLGSLKLFFKLSHSKHAFMNSEDVRKCESNNNVYTFTNISEEAKKSAFHNLSYSPATDSSIKSEDNNDPRYIYLKNSELNEKPAVICNEKFLDYDDSEYFTLKKMKTCNNEKNNLIIPFAAYDVSSTSSSSASSAQTFNSFTHLMGRSDSNKNRQNLVSSSLISNIYQANAIRQQANLNFNQNKYYL
jgi:hypothetical protein